MFAGMLQLVDKFSWFEGDGITGIVYTFLTY